MVPPIFVECYVMTCLAFHRMSIGYILAFPAAVIAGLTGNNTYIHTTKDEASWIASSFNFTGALSYFILPVIMQTYGRKLTNILHNLILVVGAVVIGAAPNIATLIAGECIQGFGFAGLPLNCMIGGEYSHPRRRGPFLVIQSIGVSVGMILCHSLAFTLTWNQIAYVRIVVPVITAISTVLWPESPSWLAYKGRDAECVKAFKVLRGNFPESRKEMRHLIVSQRQIRQNMNNNVNNVFIRTFETLRNKEFLKPLAILIVLETLVHACGLYYMIAYVIQIMQKLTGDQSKTFYYTLGFDCMKMLAVIISSILMRLLKIRTLLFCSGPLACFLLSLVCIFDYLEYTEVLALRWVTPSILVLYNFICHVSLIPIYIVVMGELFPLKYKSEGACIVGVIYSLLSFFILKLTATMLDVLKVHGTFAVYLTVAISCLIVLYFFLPETKNRTLQDIELDFIDIKLYVANNDEEMIDVIVKK